MTTSDFVRGTRKRQNIFIQILRAQAEQVFAGVEGLQKFIKAASPEDAAIVERCEKEGDELRRVLIDELHKTFVTPFDREDIFQLSLYLDDVLDYAYTTVDEMQTLKVAADQYLVQMVERLREAAEDLMLAMARLNDNPLVALEHARRAKHRENQIEKIYRQAIAELFSGPEDVHHIMAMLRQREVYRHVSNAGDQADQAANVIGSIVMKMT